MIPGTTSLRAAQLAARLTGPPTRVTSSDGMPVSFTVSVGVAESAGGGDLPDLLARADLAMYEAKRAGGACWRIFDGYRMGARPEPSDPPARSAPLTPSELVEDQDSVG
jgi:predicted signal transduction protein with EAL and GGDEF domain